MKKVILTTLIVMAFLVSVDSVYAQADKPLRVRIEVSGFDDNAQALQLITQYTRAKAGANWILVQSNPEYILRVDHSNGPSKSWTVVNQKARMRNSLLTTGQEITQRLLTDLSYRSRGVAYTLANAGRNAAYNQFEQRKHVEIQNMEKHKSTVFLNFIDAKDGYVYSQGIGQNVITVQNYRPYDGQPQVILVEGDLSTVGISSGVNLDGNMRQLLALSAFMKADLPESNIVTDR